MCGVLVHVCVIVGSFDVCTYVMCMHAVNTNQRKGVDTGRSSMPVAALCIYDGDVCLCVALASATAPCMMMLWHVAILPKTLSHERERERGRERERERERGARATRQHEYS